MAAQGKGDVGYGGEGGGDSARGAERRWRGTLQFGILAPGSVAGTYKHWDPADKSRSDEPTPHDEPIVLLGNNGRGGRGGRSSQIDLTMVSYP